MLFASISSFESLLHSHPELSYPLSLLDKASSLPLGRTEFEHGVYANVDEYDTKPVNEKGFEFHRKYIDIQLLVSGIEKIKVCPLSHVASSTEYDVQCDVTFGNPLFDNFISECVLDSSTFAVLFPKDAHMPCLCCSGETSRVRKVVFKIPCK